MIVLVVYLLWGILRIIYVYFYVVEICGYVIGFFCNEFGIKEKF